MNRRVILCFSSGLVTPTGEEVCSVVTGVCCERLHERAGRWRTCSMGGQFKKSSTYQECTVIKLLWTSTCICWKTLWDVWAFAWCPKLNRNFYAPRLQARKEGGAEARPLVKANLWSTSAFQGNLYASLKENLGQSWSVEKSQYLWKYSTQLSIVRFRCRSHYILWSCECDCDNFIARNFPLMSRWTSGCWQRCRRKSLFPNME